MRHRTWPPHDQAVESGIGTTRSASVVTWVPNVPGPKATTRRPISTESTSRADRGHDADALAADHGRVAVQPRVHPHGLQHVAEVEPRRGDAHLDLAGLGGVRVTACTVSASSCPGCRPAAGPRRCRRIDDGAARLDGSSPWPLWVRAPAGGRIVVRLAAPLRRRPHRRAVPPSAAPADPVPSASTSTMVVFSSGCSKVSTRAIPRSWVCANVTRSLDRAAARRG